MVELLGLMRRHASIAGGIIVAVCQRHDCADQKRQAPDAWARFVTELAEGKAGDVVQLSRVIISNLGNMMKVS